MSTSASEGEREAVGAWGRLRGLLRGLAPADGFDPATLDAKGRAARLRRNYFAVGASALLSFLAFPPFDFGFLAYVALVPLLVAGGLDRLRMAAALAYCATVLYHVPGLSWIAMTTPPGWLTTAFLEGFYGATLILLPLWIRARTNAPLLLTLPLLGAVLECVRGNFPFVAFPWLFWGQTQHGYPLLIQLADVTSVYGLSALVLAFNGAIADVALLLRLRWERNEDLSEADTGRLRWIVALPFMALILTLAYGHFRREDVRAAMAAAGEGPRLVLVQPDLPQTLKDSGSPVSAADENLRVTRNGLSSAAGGRIDGILWTETMWFWPLPEGDRRNYQAWRTNYLAWGAQIERALQYLNAAKTSGDKQDRASAVQSLRKLLRMRNADEPELVEQAQTSAADVRGFEVVERELLGLPGRINAPLFVGAIDFDTAGKGQNPHNSYYQIAADEEKRGHVVARYDKVECVPVSEYIPFKEESSLLHPVHRFFKGFVPPGFLVFERGKGPVLMDAGGYKLSPNICFEISFPELLRRGTEAGADVHVCPANDAWFVRGARGDQAVKTAEIDLARAHAVFRAIENRRSVVRCVNRGVSLCVDPTGEVTDELSRVDARTGKRLFVGIEGALTVQPPLTRLRSFYVRFGNAFVWLCAFLFLGFLTRALRGTQLFPPLEGVPQIPPPSSEDEAGEPEAPEGGASEDEASQGEASPADAGEAPDEGEASPPDEAEASPPDEGEASPPDEGEASPPGEGEASEGDEPRSPA